MTGDRAYGRRDPDGDGPRFGFIALIGAPNVGKSTLINQLVGTKVSIVTHKVQTTRMPIRAAYIDGNAQIVLVDTPGIFEPKRRLDRAMVKSAWQGAGDADAVVLLLDARKGVTQDDSRILKLLADIRRPKLLAINKIDLVKPEALLVTTEQANAALTFDRTFMISALNGDGTADLKAAISALLPSGAWHYPDDHLSDLPMRLLASEITREKLFLRVHDELPYALTVETEQWQDRADGSVKIDQTVYVGRESHKRILLGHKGRTIKAVSTDARHELAALLDRPVHLFLFVKVRERWVDDPERYRELGLEFPG